MKIFRLFLIIFGILSFVIFTIFGLYFLVFPPHFLDLSNIMIFTNLIAIIILFLGFIFLNKKAKIFTIILWSFFSVLLIIIAFSLNYSEKFLWKEINFLEDLQKSKNYYKVMTNISEISDEKLNFDQSKNKNLITLSKEKCENLDFIKSLADKHLNIFSIWNKKLQKIKEDIESYPKIKIFLEIKKLEDENLKILRKNIENIENLENNTDYKENKNQIKEKYQKLKILQKIKNSDEEKSIFTEEYQQEYKKFLDFMEELNTNYNGKIYCEKFSTPTHYLEIARVLANNIVLEAIFGKNENLEKNINILEKFLENNKQENITIITNYQPIEKFNRNLIIESIFMDSIKNNINLWTKNEKIEKTIKILEKNNQYNNFILALKQQYFFMKNFLKNKDAKNYLWFEDIEKINKKWMKELELLLKHNFIYSIKQIDKNNEYPKTIFDDLSEDELENLWEIFYNKYNENNKLIFLEKNPISRKIFQEKILGNYFVDLKIKVQETQKEELIKSLK